MADLFSEGLITLNQARVLPNVPERSLSTWIGWVVDGCYGVKLEAQSAGGSWCTSKAAIMRFFERCTAARLGTDAPEVARHRKAAQERAAAQLDALGIGSAKTRRK